jgi:hypothetical protein
LTATNGVVADGVGQKDVTEAKIKSSRTKLAISKVKG